MPIVEGRSKPMRKLIALAFVSLFLAVVLLNSFQRSSSALSLQYYPTVTKPNEPFEVTATVTNPAGASHQFAIEMYVNGVRVLDARSTLDSYGSQSFTYTRPGPEVGSSVRIYSQATDLATGRVYSQVVMAPPTPPELLLSFAAFSSFATSLFSTTSTSIAASSTLVYYESTVGLSSASQSPAILPPLYVATAVSLSLLGLIIFLELTDSAYGRLGLKFRLLRTRFSLLQFSLLLVFAGIVFTRVVMVIVG